MILLCALNARYIHSSLGLRYLYANMGSLQAQTEIREFTINQRALDIVEQIVERQPDIVGFGVYIWNIAQTTEVIAMLKALQPQISIILGGPEISHETEQSPAYPHADLIIRGQADLEFTKACRDLLDGHPTPGKIIDAPVPAPRQLALPYTHYTDEDIRQRVIYVEASRGCPFKCEFCLSALDKTAQAFDIEDFLDAMETLYQRGARHFKFVDRTFNLKLDTSLRILNFFLQKPLHDLNLHFELIPDRLPDALKQLIQRFPPGSLQFEIGIQSFNSKVQQLISRRQDTEKTIANLKFLRNETGVHLHTDLIAGLPGEDLQSFARGFDRLEALDPHEIQLGILKRLRGTPIIRRTQNHCMVYNPNPPYNVLSTADMDSSTLFRLNRFARYWDLIANSGRFRASLPVLLGQNPFDNFMSLSDWLFETTGQTHRIALPRLFRLLYQFNRTADMFDALQSDFKHSGIKGYFHNIVDAEQATSSTSQDAFTRQRRHIG